MAGVKKRTEPTHHCRDCRHANTKAFGPLLPACYEIGVMIGDRLVAKRITLSRKACAKFKPLEVAK